MTGAALSVAPMMGYTDRAGRYFLRRLTKHAHLYTEMLTAQAVIHGDSERLLAFDACEQPLALQIGGSDPGELAAAAKIGETFGYDGINLNLGCPSTRVGEGGFGACLMGRPERAARCVRAMADAVDIPVSVKCRIGIDEQDPERDFVPFIERLADAGCGEFIVHARKAWLNGLSPKENRTLPPLQYDVVYRLKETHPHLRIHLNGGIETLEQAQSVLRNLDGVMIGRAAFANPWMLSQVDRLWFRKDHAPSGRGEVLEEMLAHAFARAQAGEMPRVSLRHCMTLYRGIKGGKAFRRKLNDVMQAPLAENQLAQIARLSP